MNPLIERFSGLLLLTLCCSLGHGAVPDFYQHIRYADPAAEVALLLESGWRVRNHAPVFLVPPIDWAADPGDANWRYQLNALYPLAPVFASLAKEYDAELHTLARSVAEDWISFNLVQNVEHPYRWNDMATGIRATYLAQLIHYERLHGEVGSLARLEAAAVDHLLELSDASKLAKSNHALFQLVGIVALCEVIEHDRCVADLSYARDQYEATFSRQFGREGIHLEHSPGYHLLALETFLRIERSELLRLSEANQRTLDLARKNLQFMIHPDGGFAEFGDTEAGNARRAARFHSQARWLLTQGRKGEPPESGVKYFAESGLLSIRDVPAQGFLYFNTAHHSRVHKHLDTGSFEWSDRGVRVIVDSGKWGYDGGPEREYVLSDLAHNMVVTEGVSRSRGDVLASPVPVEAISSDGVHIVVGQLPAPRKLIDANHTRFFVLKPGEWLVVADLLSEFLPSNHTQWFQFPPNASVTPTKSGYSLELTAEHSMEVVSLSGAEMKEVRGQKRPLRGWYSPGYRQLVPSWQVGFEASGLTTALATLFHWRPEGLAAGQLVPPVEVLEGEELVLCWRDRGLIEGIVLQRSVEGWLPTSCNMEW